MTMLDEKSFLVKCNAYLSERISADVLYFPPGHTYPGILSLKEAVLVKCSLCIFHSTHLLGGAILL